VSKPSNPFITSGYAGAEYFCDREEESRELINHIKNGDNITLVATRRMGKTGLIEHCFSQKEIARTHYTFFIDIYATRSLRDMIFAMSKEIVRGLKPFGTKAIGLFIQTVRSLKAGVSFDSKGTPQFNLQLGEINNPEATLDEIFSYLESANKPCIVAIDEFQQVASYPEKNVEALLRTHIQRCRNARFIFAGSQAHIMGIIFLSAARPFYQSTAMMHLNSISLPLYTAFARRHFKRADKQIKAETVEAVYRLFGGVTWYVQKMLNQLYVTTVQGDTCGVEMVAPALQSIIDSYKYTYSEILFRLPEKQKELLLAIAQEPEARAVTSGEFIAKYSLSSASSVQSALKGLAEKDFVVRTGDSYRIYDNFFAIWLKENY